MNRNCHLNPSTIPTIPHPYSFSLLPMEKERSFLKKYSRKYLPKPSPSNPLRSSNVGTTICVQANTDLPMSGLQYLRTSQHRSRLSPLPMHMACCAVQEIIPAQSELQLDGHGRPAVSAAVPPTSTHPPSASKIHQRFGSKSSQLSDPSSI